MAGTDNQTIDPMPALWEDFLKSNPGPEFKPWEEMDEFEQAMMRIQVWKQANGK